MHNTICNDSYDMYIKHCDCVFNLFLFFIKWLICLFYTDNEVTSLMVYVMCFCNINGLNILKVRVVWELPSASFMELVDQHTRKSEMQIYYLT